MPVKVRMFTTAREAALFMNQNGLALDEIAGLHPDGSNHIMVFYEDSGGAILDTAPGLVGVSYGEDENLDGTTLVPVQAKRTAITNENLGADVAGVVTPGTLAQRYVIPGTLVLDDSGGDAPTLVDDGFGKIVLQSKTSEQRGTIAYHTGAYVIQYPQGEYPSGNVLADYQYSDLPDTGDVPTKIEIDALIVSCDSGALVTAFDWEIHETSNASTPPVASGLAVPIVAGDSVRITLNKLVSIQMDQAAAQRVRRWVRITPDDNTNEFSLYMYWADMDRGD